MRGILFTDTVTRVPAVWANAVNALVYDVFGAAKNVEEARKALALESMAFQRSGQVAITGGSINGTNIGTVEAIPLFIATAGQVRNDPVNGYDIVNRSWLEQWARTSFATLGTSVRGSLGTMSVQNANNVAITSGTINSTDIGNLGRASGRFTTLKAANPPIDGDDVVTLGWLSSTYDVLLNRIKSMAFQDSRGVAITGGEIDGARIGLTAPVTLRVLTGTLIAAPTTLESLVNKLYVDSSIGAFAATLGSMAFQSANAVNIIGGRINGTIIGNSSPAPATFSEATVASSTAAYLNLRTLGSTSVSRAGVRWMDGTAVAASFVYYGSNNGPQSNKVILDSNAILEFRTLGAAIVMEGAHVQITGTLVSLASTANNQLVVGGGEARSGYNATFNLPTFSKAATVEKLDVVRGLSHELNRVHAMTAAGNITLQVQTHSAFFINLTGDANISLPSSDPEWTGMRSVKMIVRHNSNGKQLDWPSNVFWGQGAQPDYSEALAEDFDIIELLTITGGQSWFGTSAYGASQIDGDPLIIMFAAT